MSRIPVESKKTLKCKVVDRYFDVNVSHCSKKLFLFVVLHFKLSPRDRACKSYKKTTHTTYFSRCIPKQHHFYSNCMFWRIEKNKVPFKCRVSKNRNTLMIQNTHPWFRWIVKKLMGLTLAFNYDNVVIKHICDSYSWQGFLFATIISHITFYFKRNKVLMSKGCGLVSRKSLYNVLM